MKTAISSSFGNSSGLMDQRKRKRMQSNRESARRSRIRKRKHLEDLRAGVAEMSKENCQLLNSIAVSTLQCVKMEAENSVLKAQIMELSQRLQALIGLLNLIAATSAAGSCMFVEADDQFQLAEGCWNNSWNLIEAKQQSIIFMAAAEMMHNCC